MADMTGTRIKLDWRNEDAYKCPVCGDTSITFTDQMGDFNYVDYFYSCDSCGSEFAFNYRIHSVSVEKDNR